MIKVLLILAVSVPLFAQPKYEFFDINTDTLTYEEAFVEKEYRQTGLTIDNDNGRSIDFFMDQHVIRTSTIINNVLDFIDDVRSEIGDSVFNEILIDNKITYTKGEEILGYEFWNYCPVCFKQGKALQRCWNSKMYCGTHVFRNKKGSTEFKMFYTNEDPCGLEEL